MLDDDTLARPQGVAARGAQGPITPSVGGQEKNRSAAVPGRQHDRAHRARQGARRGVSGNFRVVSAIEARCGTSLAGTNLRIEYAQDSAGFWLEPHTDIGVKALTMFIYLDDGDEDRDWGTDLYSDRHTPTKRLPFVDNTGVFFIPGDETWHGFLPRRIDGVRRSLIVNFVTSEWRNRRELAYPDRPVG